MKPKISREELENLLELFYSDKKLFDTMYDSFNVSDEEALHVLGEWEKSGKIQHVHYISFTIFLVTKTMQGYSEYKKLLKHK